MLQGNNDTWLIEQIRNESYTLQVGNKRYELSNHLGNVLAVVSDKKEQSDGVTWSAIVVSAQDYYPFGMAMPGRSNGAYRYGFNGKETDPETGIQDYGMRWYLPNIARFLQVDPGAYSYPNLSPYTYVANNPLIYIDPTGAYIEPGSQKEWDGQTAAVKERRDGLLTQVDNLNKLATETKVPGLKEVLEKSIGDLNSRITSLNSTLTEMSDLEKSTQGYSLNKRAGEVGKTTYNATTGFIVMTFNNTANFVHELTHAGQFETGDLAFDIATGGSVVSDVGDERNAYKAQFAYDPPSVSADLTSISSATSFEMITAEWVQGIKTVAGDK